MTKNEIIAKVHNTRLDESVYIYVNGKMIDHNWACFVAKVLEENLEDDKNYEIDFDYPYRYRVYTAYGKVTVKEV